MGEYYLSIIISFGAVILSAIISYFLSKSIAKKQVTMHFQAEETRDQKKNEERDRITKILQDLLHNRDDTKKSYQRRTIKKLKEEVEKEIRQTIPEDYLIDILNKIGAKKSYSKEKETHLWYF